MVGPQLGRETDAIAESVSGHKFPLQFNSAGGRLPLFIILIIMTSHPDPIHILLSKNRETSEREWKSAIASEPF